MRVISGGYGMAFPRLPIPSHSLPWYDHVQPIASSADGFLIVAISFSFHEIILTAVKYKAHIFGLELLLTK